MEYIFQSYVMLILSLLSQNPIWVIAFQLPKSEESFLLIRQPNVYHTCCFWGFMASVLWSFLQAWWIQHLGLSQEPDKAMLLPLLTLKSPVFTIYMWLKKPMDSIFGFLQTLANQLVYYQSFDDNGKIKTSFLILCCLK